MTARSRATLAALAAATLAVAALAAAGLRRRDPPAPLDASPALVARGAVVYRNKCLHCHRDIPLARRVAGWTLERAYDAVGRLPEIYPAMPAFHGSDAERRALAAFLASGEAP